MDIKGFLPVLVPGILMQFLIQAYFIRHCWENKGISRAAKIIYIIAIAVFNILAAAAYLFLTRIKDAEPQGGTADAPNDSSVRQGVFVLLIMAYEVFSLRLLFMGVAAGHSPVIAWLLSACFVLLIVHGLADRKLPKPLYNLLPVAQIALVLAVDYLDHTGSGQFLVLAVMAGIVNAFPPKRSKIYAASMLASYIALNIWKVAFLPALSPDDIISYIYVNLLVYVMVFLSFYMLKKQLFLNTQLSAALKTLREQSLQLEEMATLAERSRITGAIHDTVGHTLTSAVIALEAGEKLLDRGDPSAREKFSLAREQVRRGLQDIRHSVKTIQAGGEQQFLPALDRMLQEVRRNTGLAVNAIADIQSSLLPIQQNVLLRAIQECATNSIKHGQGTEADLLLQEHNNAIHMTFSDNGQGTDQVVFGFGLANMAKRVEGIGGVLRAESAKGEGFTVNIVLPAGQTMGGDLP